MTKVKDYGRFLSEGVARTKNGYALDFSKDSPGDVMPLKFMNRRRKPMEKDGVKYSYYFAYSHKNSSDRELLQYLKKLQGEPREMRAFVKKAVLGLDREVDLSTFDAVVFPKSSSLLLRAVAEYAAEKSGNANLYPASFRKTNKEEIRLDTDALEEVDEKTRKRVTQMFDRCLNSDGEFKMKKIFAPYRKFIRNFISFDASSGAHNDILGGKVLLVDDYRTTGTTLKEMLDQMIVMQPREIVVMVVIDVK